MTDDGAVTWSNIFTFELRSCQVSTCHGSGLAGVVMTNKDAAWDSLVNKPAAPDRMCAQLGKQRVVPGKPDESLMYLKLDVNAPCGQQMPPGGQLSQKARDRVKAWIEMGAEKD
jgi:cytochrome c5